MTTPISIDGPAGRLEALWSETTASGNNSADNAISPVEPRCALLCHPHPQYGGSMHDSVLAIAADVLAANGIAQLRFNFRGVGASDGQFDHGEGEGDDICAAWEWLGSQSPTGTQGWVSRLLVGYSFGAATAWAARARCESLDRLVLIAPPTQAMSFSGEAGTIPTRVIAGDGDSYCDLSTMPAGVSTQVIAGADHFFNGTTGQLAAAIAAAIVAEGSG